MASLRPADVMAIGLWFGLMAGFSELLFIGVEVFRPQQPWPGFLYTNPQGLWLTPLASGMLVLGVSAIVALAVAVVPKAMPARVALTLIAIPACLAAVFHFRDKLDERALLLLAIGLGFQLANVAASRLDRLMRLVRRTMPLAFGLTAVIALVVNGRPFVAEQIGLSRLAVPDASAPNVLLIVMDTVRASDVELDDDGALTPR